MISNAHANANATVFSTTYTYIHIHIFIFTLWFICVSYISMRISQVRNRCVRWRYKRRRRGKRGQIHQLSYTNTVHRNSLENFSPTTRSLRHQSLPRPVPSVEGEYIDLAFIQLPIVDNSYSIFIQAIKDIILDMDWESFTAIYENPDGLIRLKDLLMHFKYGYNAPGKSIKIIQMPPTDDFR